MGFYVGDTRATKVYLGDTLIYQDGFGKKLFKKAYGTSTFTDITSTVTWNSGTLIFEVNVNNMPGDEIYVTIDNQEPKQDWSNVGFYYVCTQINGTFSIVNATPWTDGSQSSLLFITL